MVKISDIHESRLLESPMAVMDDWEGKSIKLEHISKPVIAAFWRPIGKSSTPQAYIVGNERRAVLGVDSEIVPGYLKLLTEMSLIPRADTHRLYNKTIIVSGVKTPEDLRGSGYGYTLYQALLDDGYAVMSDRVQFNGARKIYQKFSDSGTVIVDLFDDKEKEFIAKDVKLQHGAEMWEIDDKVWSFDNSKGDIRIILRKKV